MKNQPICFFIWVLILNVAFCYAQSEDPRSLSIKIISYRNGVGLDQDIDIIAGELIRLGHHVDTWDYRNFNPRPKVDINLFIEVVHGEHYQYADKNYLLINPEWYLHNGDTLRDFDKILCKTKEAERILKQYNPNAVYMSFSCQDRYDPLIEKDYRQPLHLVGGSLQKNTDEVVKAWQQNPQLPLITIVKHRGPWDHPAINNINLIYHYLCHAEIVHKQNFFGMQICPSSTEGFGHYIVEALGCSDVVVTLDAPPMNEFVQDKRCLVKARHAGTHYLADIYHVDPNDLAQVVENLLALPDRELLKIGRKNRRFFLENLKVFRRNLIKIFPPPKETDLNEFIGE